MKAEKLGFAVVLAALISTSAVAQSTMGGSSPAAPAPAPAARSAAPSGAGAPAMGSVGGTMQSRAVSPRANIGAGTIGSGPANIGAGGAIQSNNSRWSGHRRGGRGFYGPGFAVGAGYGYGYGYDYPYYDDSYSYGAYAYEGDCSIRRRVVVDRHGHRHLRRVRVCY